MADIVLRVHSRSGRSRFSLRAKATLSDLKILIAERLHVPLEKQLLSTEEKGQLTGLNSSSLSSLGIAHGTIVNLDSEAEIPLSSSPGPRLPSLSPQDSSEPSNPEHAHIRKCTHGPNQRCINCLTRDDAKSREEGKTEPAKKDTSWLCRHAPEGKCINCLKDDFVAGIKHQSFEHFMSARRSKCQHPASSKCPNCMPPNEVSYKTNTQCTKHPPWPASICNSCMPPTAVLARQPFRHVDYMELMNVDEVTNFVRYWQDSHSMQQRVGFLYGYYAEDPNYPDGVRAVMETIYEPPQLGDMNGFQVLEDPFMEVADTIAGALELEKIGWMFTSINHDAHLSSIEVQRAAGFQEKYFTVHSSGYKVSKFVTVVLKPTDDGNSMPEAYMVSDQCQALERDGIFGDPESRKRLNKRQPAQNELLPTIMCENAPTEEFPPEWFIVNLGCGIPTKAMTLFSHNDFPIENRGREIGLGDLKQYLAKYKNEPLFRRCSNFHFLLQMARHLDVASAVMAAECVAAQIELPLGLREILNAL